MNALVTSDARSIGKQIRDWRQRRRMSQLEFALDVKISQKHLSFIESGRSSPSREMVLRLAEHLKVPLRERNMMLLAAGYAPVFPERRLDDPALQAARAAIDLLLKAHEPFPAIAIDRHWTLMASNAVVPALLELVADKSLLEPPVNVLRVSLMPGGLAPHIVNLPEWRAHLLARLRHQIDMTADPKLEMLFRDLQACPVPATHATEGTFDIDHAGIVVPFRLKTPGAILSFLSTTTVFGTPVDITLSELAMETFFPADAATAEALRVILEGQSSHK
ncbi:MAG: helix-turn-helix transcriptional regulator [Beijerinckiaceae bacterium]|nr:helix-turn-helix transcriptional regulator [Beijerinckiaceae bacterium]